MCATALSSSTTIKSVEEITARPTCEALHSCQCGCSNGIGKYKRSALARNPDGPSRRSLEALDPSKERISIKAFTKHNMDWLVRRMEAAHQEVKVFGRVMTSFHQILQSLSPSPLLFADLADWATRAPSIAHPTLVPGVGCLRRRARSKLLRRLPLRRDRRGIRHGRLQHRGRRR